MSNDARSVGRKLLGAIGAQAGLAIGAGIALIVAGLLAIAAPFVAGVSAMVVIGSVLLVGGIALVLVAFRLGAFGAGLPLLMIGVLMVLAGLYGVTRPASALATMTFVLATYLIATGILELFAAVGTRPEPGWGRMAFSAALTLLLGIMLWRQFPISGMWAIGTLIGVNLVMNGALMVSVGSAVRGGAGALKAAMKP